MIKFLAALKSVFFLASKNCKSLIKLWQQYCTVEDISVMLSLMLPTILRTFLGTVPQGFQSLWFKDRAIFSKLALPLTWKKRSCPRQDKGLSLKICSNFVRSVVPSKVNKLRVD